MPPPKKAIQERIGQLAFAPSDHSEVDLAAYHEEFGELGEPEEPDNDVELDTNTTNVEATGYVSNSQAEMVQSKELQMEKCLIN